MSISGLPSLNKRPQQGGGTQKACCTCTLRPQVRAGHTVRACSASASCGDWILCSSNCTAMVELRAGQRKHGVLKPSAGLCHRHSLQQQANCSGFLKTAPLATEAERWGPSPAQASSTRVQLYSCHTGAQGMQDLHFPKTGGETPALQAIKNNQVVPTGAPVPDQGRNLSCTPAHRGPDLQRAIHQLFNLLIQKQEHQPGPPLNGQLSPTRSPAYNPEAAAET